MLLTMADKRTRSCPEEVESRCHTSREHTFETDSAPEHSGLSYGQTVITYDGRTSARSKCRLRLRLQKTTRHVAYCASHPVCPGRNIQPSWSPERDRINGASRRELPTQPRNTKILTQLKLSNAMAGCIVEVGGGRKTAALRLGRGPSASALRRLSRPRANAIPAPSVRLDVFFPEDLPRAGRIWA